MNPVYGDPVLPCNPDHSKCKRKLCKKRGYHSDVYQPGIIDFMAKADAEAKKGATVVCLVPARTDTEWWERYCAPYERRFLRGRLRFFLRGEESGTAPFPSAIVIMRPPTMKGRYTWHTVFPGVS